MESDDSCVAVLAEPILFLHVTLHVFFSLQKGDDVLHMVLSFLIEGRWKDVNLYYPILILLSTTRPTLMQQRPC